jgi:hypothetical protein
MNSFPCVVVRAAMARKRFADIRERYRAAIMIQKHVRRWRTRRAYQIKKKQVVRVQSGTNGLFCFHFLSSFFFFFELQQFPMSM